MNSLPAAWAGLLADSASPHSYRRLDDADYTLCVLMGQRNVADAAAQAESPLARVSAEKDRHRAEPARTVIR